jgi:serine/threonine-protein kinase
MMVDRFILPSMTSGQATISVPNVIGLSEQNAQKQIQNRNLTFEIDKRLYSDKIPEGAIISQVPLPKSFVKEGRFIYVTISKGKELVRVPHIEGQISRNAKLNLMKIGLEIGKIDYDFSETIGKDTIIQQSIPAGQKIPYGSQINIVVSKGSEVQLKIPMLVGLPEFEAVTLINESGLILGSIEYRHDNTFYPNIVIDQIPPPGTIANPNTAIKIIVTE